MADMMMWYVESNKKNKIISAEEGKRALKHFKKKYNRNPSVIFINPKNQIEEIKDIKTIENETVLASHLYIAENEEDMNPIDQEVDYRGIEDYN